MTIPFDNRYQEKTRPRMIFFGVCNPISIFIGQHKTFCIDDQGIVLAWDNNKTWMTLSVFYKPDDFHI